MFNQVQGSVSPVMSTHRKLTVAVPVFLLMSGVIDIGLRFLMIGRPDWAYLSIIQDPAKTVMHVLLLPLAGYIIVDRFPVNFIRSLIKDPTTAFLKAARVISIILGLVLAGIVVTIIVKDPQDGFCSRLPTPADVKSDLNRDAMAETRQQWLQELRKGTAQFGDKSLQYQKYVELTKKVRGSDCNAWKLMTLRGYWAVFLTFQALVVIAVFLWLNLTYLASRTKPTQRVWEGFVIFVVLLAPWIPMRPLSEWIINFGQYKIGTYLPWFLAVLFLFGAAFMVTVLTPGKNMAKIVSIVFGSASTLFGAVAAFWPGVFDPIAEAFTTQSTYLITIEYLIVFLIMILVVWFYSPIYQSNRARRRAPRGRG